MLNHATSQKEALLLAGALLSKGAVNVPKTLLRSNVGLRSRLSGVAGDLRIAFSDARISSGRLAYRPCNPLFLPKTCITGNRHNPLIAPKSTAGGRRHNSLIKLNSVESAESGKSEQYSASGELRQDSALGSAIIRIGCNKENQEITCPKGKDGWIFSHEGNQEGTKRYATRKPFLDYGDNQQFIRVAKRYVQSLPSLRGELLQVTESYPLNHTGISGEVNRVTGSNSVQFSGSDLAFLRCRRLISPLTAVTKRELQICRLTQPLAESNAHQPFGSIPSRFNRWRQASLTQELKLPLPAMESICSSNASSKRIFFFVLPERSKAGLSFLSCIGTYRWNRINDNGTYQIILTQPLKAAKPGCALTHTGPLTKPLYEVTIMADTQSTQIRPKFQYRFMALARADLSAKLCRLSIEATSEREARLILAPHYILSFAGRLPVPEAYHA